VKVTFGTHAFAVVFLNLISRESNRPNAPQVLPSADVSQTRQNFAADEFRLKNKTPRT